MIEINKVTKEYEKGVKAVNNLSLTIKSGEIFGLLGPNGAGKTTLLKMITGVLDANQGDIIVNRYDIKKQAIEAKRQFGFVSDNPDIFLRLKGIEYLKFIASVYDVEIEIRNRRIEELAKKFEMADVLGNKIDSYSHGMRQKIVLIGALIHNPQVWILDEPLTGLDPQSAYLLKEMMKDHVRSGKTVLFSTHVLDVAEKIVDRIGIIKKGELVFVGTIEDLKNRAGSDKSLEKLFLEITSNE